ncbi:DNA photolyase family protein [Candidatus Pseudothioglobus singularis]|nr:DNA photolyase family protein [Candidatus Pseudothioglobus singularis]
MTNIKAIHWFRQDLRLSDNPSLHHATKNGQVLPVYILDDQNSVDFSMGGASRFWLYHSLKSLNENLNNNLSLYQGDPLKVLLDIIDCNNITAVYWNRCYEPWRITRDTKIKSALESKGISVFTYNGSLLWEPWTIKKDDGTPYKVFTPFYRKGCLNSEEPRRPLPKVSTSNLIVDNVPSLNLEDLSLIPTFRWDIKIKSHWDIGEIGAYERLTKFINSGIKYYKEGRNFPAKPFVSRISPHMHFGELSPNQAWYLAKEKGGDKNIDHFLSELGWREFSYCQLYFNPDLPRKNLQSKFDAFSWEDNPTNLLAWQKGQTGIPMVDAGMRELWLTGSMHNRVRMVVGSFLVKNLLINWHHGERWFWDCLVDADLASNSASWQWIAGCGADAAPYFRIFNPVTQGEKFDPDGEYIRQYIPELKELPNKYLYNPSEAPKEVLDKANIVIGKDYPEPIINLKASREKALDAFKSLKKEEA